MIERANSKRIIFILILGISHACSQPEGKELSKGTLRVTAFVGDFESGTLNGWTSGEAAAAERLLVVSAPEPVRRGRYALKVTLKPEDIAAKRNRAEITRYNNDPPGSEAWYAWSFYIPENYVDVSPHARKFQIMGQWHDQPNFKTGETWENFPAHPPVISIQYALEKGRPAIGLLCGLEPRRKLLAISAVTKGKWNDLLFHIRWSRGNDGFVETWLNGRLLAARTHGPNLYTRVPNFLKIGLYRQFGIESTNSIYFDEVRIGNSREEVVVE